MSKKISAPIISALLLFGWMFSFFGDVFIHPNKHLFNEQGDGIKSFYVYADHIKNDDSYNQMRNMNYPYGQTHIFTDGQTAIANTIKFLSSYSSFFETHSIGIYNYLILFSFVLCAFFIALILQRFGLPPLIVIAGAFCITVLSPQIMRISGHPTLSYAFFFPLSWYLLMKCIDSNFKISLMLLIVLNTTFWFFVHPYLGMIITLFYSSCVIIFLIQKKRKKLLAFNSLLSFFLIIVTPIVLLKLYTSYYDYHEFRSEYPWGFWVFYSRFASVFLPHSVPFSRAVDYIFDVKTIQWDMETLAYIGLACDVVLLFCVYRFIRYVVKKRSSRILNLVLPEHLSTALWAAVLLLLFSMCIPFKFGLHSFVDKISLLRQFRSLGRFAWVFYYVATVYSVYTFWLFARRLMMKGKKVLSYTISALFFLMFIIEARADFKERARWAVLPLNLFNEDNLKEEYKSLINEVNKVKDDFQCIIPLPFYHVGSENFGVEYSEENIRISMLVSYWCNIPMMSNSAARTPILESKNIMQFFSPRTIEKKIRNDFSSKKDFLLLLTKEQLNEQESELIGLSEKIFDNGKYELWKLPFEKPFANDSKIRRKEFDSLRGLLIAQDSFEVTKAADTLVYNNFDSLENENVYRGKGALKAEKKNFTTLFEATGRLKADKDYVLSFWYFNKGELRNQILCAVEECDNSGNNCRWEITTDIRTSMVIDGDWTLVEKKFRIKDSSERIKIFVKGDDNSKQDIFIDEFLLRPAETDVYKVVTSSSDSLLFKNNLWIR